MILRKIILLVDLMCSGKAICDLLQQNIIASTL
jgi:hypothetical protein